MSETAINYQKLCMDLCDVVSTAQYFLAVRNDPSGALEVLRAAQERAVESYLSCCGPIYGANFKPHLDTPGESC